MNKENQFTGGGGFLLVLGALAFFLPMSDAPLTAPVAESPGSAEGR